MPGISATADESKRLFQAAAGLSVKGWGEESEVVFVSSTRSTHLIDRATGLLLRALLGAQIPCDALTLWARLDVDAVAGDEGSEAPPADELSALEMRLQTLVESGMIFSPSTEPPLLKC